jgi:glutathione S-transferase
MTDELVLYYNPFSRARIAHWMLEEVGQPYRIALLRLDRGEHKRADYLAINPMGKVPALVHRGAVITECAAICAYLADAFPRAGLAPSLDDPRRGGYLRWLFFGAGCIEPAVTDRSFGRALPDRPGAIGYGSYEDVMNTLEAALGHSPYLLGVDFSAADLYVASQLGWGIMTKSIAPRPAFRDYLERCQARPGFHRMLASTAEYIKQLAPK